MRTLFLRTLLRSSGAAALPATATATSRPRQRLRISPRQLSTTRRSAFDEMSASAVSIATPAGRSLLLGSGIGPHKLLVGGHRGMGENLLHAHHGHSLRFRENTLASFRESVAAGVTFVEFDVQVTADGVPVVFHDDLIEWGDPADHRSASISELTLAQFKALCGSATPTEVVRKTRGEGLAWQEQRGAWNCAVEDEMPTLAELFDGLPEHVGFDVEVKMTTPKSEITSTAELNRMLGPIMDVVAKHARDRLIVYSSFDPDICTRLSAEQATHPVLFLTACEQDHCDPRRQSVVAAVDVAKGANFAGIVVDTAHLAEFPSLIGVVKAQGLFLGTYGLKNDDEEWVAAQVAAGVDAIIADDVNRIVTHFGLMSA
mmetsp:Transcript_11319/g.28563  ORF Transcript_11319/g.28563 Transcript_11319/m.28563 type:complete len:373 (-) Transcript_11319:255-1373(-)